ncbi:MAG TPA: hypothetical protein VNO31_01215 [Umezawaea sp.]|nr:hypothetical protein [Umezawaea sp.]
MSGRILRTELHRSVAPLTVVLGLFLGIGVPLLFRDGVELAQWNQLAGYQRGVLEYLCPLALGAGAWQGRRDHRSNMIELLTTTPRPGWQRVLPSAAALAIALLIGYLAVFLTQVGGVDSSYLHFGWIPTVLVGVVALLAAGLLGQGIGRAAPSVLTAPLLVIAPLFGLAATRGLLELAPDVTGWSFVEATKLLVPNVPGGGRTFDDVAGSVHLGQAIWFAALAATGLALAAAATRRARLGALLPLGLGLVVALPILPQGMAAVYVHDQASTEQICTPDLPRVCVTRAHAAALDGLTGPGREALRLLATLPDPPTSVAEDWHDPSYQAPVKPQPLGVLLIHFSTYLDLDARSRVKRDKDELLGQLLEGAGTTPCAVGLSDMSQEEQTFSRKEKTARLLAARVLSPALPPVKPPYSMEDVSNNAWALLQTLPVEERQRRGAALRAAALSCRGDLMDILTTGGTR